MGGTYSQQQLELKFNAISERLAAIEGQLKTLSDQAGVSYDEPFAELPRTCSSSHVPETRWRRPSATAS